MKKKNFIFFFFEKGEGLLTLFPLDELLTIFCAGLERSSTEEDFFMAAC